MPDDLTAELQKRSKPKKAGKAKQRPAARRSQTKRPETSPSPSPSSAPIWPTPQEMTAYGIDVMQRQVLFFDTLRQRANAMLAHEAEGARRRRRAASASWASFARAAARSLRPEFCITNVGDTRPRAR